MKTKRILSALMVLLLMASLPVSALAEEYNIDEGSITVSADSTGQYVTQDGGVQNELQTTETVITQTDSSTATSNTITVTTTGDAVAEFTLREVNIKASGDAVDIGDSSAEITLEGDNELYSKSGSAVHISGGDLTLTGDGSLEADNSYNDNAAIGSHVYEDMSGSVTIGGSAQVTALGGGYGASIGSGYGGEMSGNVTVDGKAEVTAVSDDDGAGIGSGGYGEMSGSVVITDHAQVTAWSDAEGAGIGSGDHGDLSGSIIIGGSAQVIAAGNDESSGIGTGNKGTVTSGARIIIRDNANVTAIGEDEGCGIGSSENKNMDGLIIIRDNARVTAIAGDESAAIGSEEWYDLEGSIIIIGNADVSTGMLLDDDVSFDYDTKEIKYTVDPDAVGVIGDGNPSHHDSNYGNYILGSDVTINGIKGSDTEALREYVNMRLSGDENDGDPENLTMLDYVINNNEVTVTATGEGQILMLLYDGNETPPTEPGTYPVTVVMRISEESEECLEFEICDLVISDQESATTDDAQDEPLYHVTDKDDKDISYKAEQKDGVLTITADRDFAILTGQLWGISVLKSLGVEEIVFVTNGATSTFTLDDLLENGSSADTYKLTHDGAALTFTFGTENIDISDIL